MGEVRLTAGDREWEMRKADRLVASAIADPSGAFFRQLRVAPGEDPVLMLACFLVMYKVVSSSAP